MEKRGLMTFDASAKLLDLIRLAQHNERLLSGRNDIVNVSALAMAAPKPTTDAAEKDRRITHYKGAAAMLAWAGAVINDAVENGMDVQEATDPLSFLLLAAAGYTYVTAIQLGEEG